MTPRSDRPTAQRRAVLGFLAGTVLGGLFGATVFFLDIGHVASLTARAGGFPLRDLGSLMVTFGLVGLVAAPALGSTPRQGTG